MSLVVQGLGYAYGRHRVLEDISFSAEKGHIVGMLGPNGAGKSTTMKLLSTQLIPSAGQVFIHGYDAAHHTQRIRHLLGYLPEHNPLYEDMYVREFLRFIGKLYGLKRQEISTHMQELIACCGLEEVQTQRIATLSRGYKQRLGLARVYMHKPSILLLDEATAGLDPNQLRDIRQLLSTWKKTCTILFSTHVLQEVEALCDQVILLHQGHILAHQSLSDFKKQHTTGCILQLQFDQDIATERFEHLLKTYWQENTKDQKEAISHKLHIEAVKTGHYHLHVPKYVLEALDKSQENIRAISQGTSPQTFQQLRMQVLAWAQQEQLPLIALEIMEPSLEHIFHHLTQKIA